MEKDFGFIDRRGQEPILKGATVRLDKFGHVDGHPGGIERDNGI